MKQMKRISLALSLMLLLGGSNAYAQDKDFSVKTNVFGIFVGQYQGAFEMALNEKLSVQMSAGYISRTFTINGAFGDNYKIGPKGFIIIPEFRYYFKEALNGFYGAGFIRYRNVNQIVQDNISDFLDWSGQRKKTSVGGGIVLGYQVLMGGTVVMDMFIGPQYKAVSRGDWEFKVPSVIEDDITVIIDDKGDSDGVGVRFGVNLGIAF